VDDIAEEDVGIIEEEDADTFTDENKETKVKPRKKKTAGRAGRFESGEYWRTDGMLSAGGVSARSARLDWTPGVYTRAEEALYRREVAARCARRGM
jgi:hypothetical protein